MKIAILTRDNKLYSCKRIYDSAIQRGHLVSIIDPNMYFMSVSNLYPKKYQTDFFDVIISRINPNNNFYGISILRNFEIYGTYTLNKSESIIKAKDKIWSLQLLSQQGINIPITAFSGSFDNSNNIIDIVGGPPLIIKLVNGTQGIGVILANTKQSAISIIETFKSINAKILVQEYIEESNGCDIRCLVIGKKVVGAIKRIAKIGEFRSNLHRGGIAEIIEISDIEEQLAIKAAGILGLSIAGVDILRSSRGPLITEVNASPGIEGIENATKLNIAELIIKYLEKHFFR